MMYSTIKNLIPNNVCNQLVEAINADTINESIYGLKDLKRFRFDSAKNFNRVQMHIQPEIEEAFGVKLLPTYNYSRIYYYGAELKKHKDRSACEYSVTVNLKQEGGIWPIWMQIDNNKEEFIELIPGDSAIYKGCDVLHWREENEIGKCHQIFFHYVEENGPLARFAYDKDKNYYFSCLQNDKTIL